MAQEVEILVYLDQNDMTLEIRNLKNNVTGSAISSIASHARFTLYDEFGREISGVAWPQNFSLVSAGTLRGSVSNALAVRVGQVGEIEIDVDAGASQTFFGRFPFRVQNRGGGG